MEKFDPNSAPSQDSGIFGLPYSEDESQLVIIPVPWEATTSYGGGTSLGPQAILHASKQIDLFDMDILKPYEPGICLLPESEEVKKWNQEAKKQAQRIIEVGGHIEDRPDLKEALGQVNELGQKLNEFVYQETSNQLKKDKIVGILGGDHSVPYGALKAISKKYPSFGILHLDAHSDTRDCFEGFQWSHASIMNNVLNDIPSVIHLAQVGIRDLCEEEHLYCLQQKSRVSSFYDRDLMRRKFEGISWAQLAREIVATLPQNVWVSFDIDGLDPRFCPHTGTPVPGGLDFHEANYLIGTLVRSGRKIIGFDLNEVAPNLEDEEDEWDANVGARMLYKLCGWTFASHSKAPLQL